MKKTSSGGGEILSYELVRCRAQRRVLVRLVEEARAALQRQTWQDGFNFVFCFVSDFASRAAVFRLVRALRGRKPNRATAVFGCDDPS